MKKSDINPMPEYFDKYINLSDDIELDEALKNSLVELKTAPIEQWKAIGDKVYAVGKWTIKDILQHIIDAERIFAYRALCFARGETANLPSFDEDDYAKNAIAFNQTIEDLIDELVAVRISTIALFKSFNSELLQRKGMGFKGLYSVLAIGFITVGHQKWHFKIIEERYAGL